MKLETFVTEPLDEAHVDLVQRWIGERVQRAHKNLTSTPTGVRPQAYPEHGARARVRVGCAASRR